MAESLLPAGLKIRVLTTIENGAVIQEALRDDQLVATTAEFITAAHHAGLVVSRKILKREWADAISLANYARELLIAQDSVKTTDQDRQQLWQIIELVSETISSLKKINTGE